MEHTAERIRFDFLPGLPIVVETQPTLLSSDAGILPLRPFDDQIGFTERFVDGLHDPRDLHCRVCHPVAWGCGLCLRTLGSGSYALRIFNAK